MIDQRHTITRWVSLLYRYGQMYIGERLKAHGIGKGQHIFLNALYKEDGLSQEELSSYLKIDKGTTAKALKKLEAQGYVLRQVREEDKRSYRVFLTEKAWRIKDEVRGVLTDWRHILSDGLTEEEQRLALELLEKMGGNAARFNEENDKTPKA
ncbi:MarR family transcriptional regulator [Paenibacillus tyrfis]|uniref:MarR family winged helix-turn-helix transcriptional regulator n=1 Tax=Paenibacillus TaxID=44249 RepID=UPI0024939B24|nr:MarR family transcriptional regulator [Paenibacillus tyrfis]GLI06117.1 MarR family transcriptional regulator [Paenibacillus tyrfis]GMX60914.1 MarR family transcriptional regulator [Paenibacillus elgii]